MRLLPAEILCLGLLLPLAAAALPSDREQPLQVSANSARFNEKTGIATYTGAVVVQQGTLEIRAEEVIIRVDRKGAVTSTEARGAPARYQQQTDPKKGPVTAEAARIDYDASNEIVTLSGNARLRQEGSSFQGSTITYNSLRQQVDAKGEGADRVQLVFPAQARDSRAREKDRKN
ncbi:MAG: lipopolysaccharide transport periplasmic protein LptA [Pseudomonadota bacterium]